MHVQLATERRPASGQQPQAHWATIEQVPERMRRMLEQTLGSFVSPALLSEAATWTRSSTSKKRTTRT